MRTTIRSALILIALAAPAASASAQEGLSPAQGATVAPNAVAPTADAWTREELENLLAPVALYPDPILAQVLIAATYPEQIAAAAAYVRLHGTSGLDEMPWDLSVRAVAHYAPVLNLMADGEDWTTALGQAYATQPQDVMGAVQSLRRMANAHGNLATTDQQQVLVEQETIKILPAQPKVIYVPTYDPAVIYFRPVYVHHAHPAYWAWGDPYPIGVWLSYDFDWHSHRVYHHGWHGPRWVVVSRPWIVISPWYVGPRWSVVVVNHRVVNRRIDYVRLNRHTWVHRRTTFDRRRDVARNDRYDRYDRRDDRRDDRYDRRDDRRDDRYDRRDDRRDDRVDRREDRRDPKDWNRGNGPGWGRRNDRPAPGRGNMPAPTRPSDDRRQIVKGPTWSRTNAGVPSLGARSTPRDTPRDTPRGTPQRNDRRDTPGRTERVERTERSTPRERPTIEPKRSEPNRVMTRPPRREGSSTVLSPRSRGSSSTPRASGGSRSSGERAAPRSGGSGSRGTAGAARRGAERSRDRRGN
jgi:uncharacterized membrane protein YgcG